MKVILIFTFLICSVKCGCAQQMSFADSMRLLWVHVHAQDIAKASADSLNAAKKQDAIKAQIDKGINFIRGVEEISKPMQGWGLLILGSSILIVISSDYIRPTRKMRRIYLFFLPGWICILISMYFGMDISQCLVGTLMAGKTDAIGIAKLAKEANDDFGWLQFYFKLSIICFSIWLVIILFYWVLNDKLD